MKKASGLIAAIAALGLITAIGVPRGPSRSMQTFTRSDANMDTVTKGLAAFAAQSGNTASYPPAYGYLELDAAGKPV